MIKIIKDEITLTELKKNAAKMFGNLVKGVVDIDQEIIALYGELHADEEAFLIENGSIQESLWGINLYPKFFGTDDFLEFDSMINLRPSQNNMSRGVDNPATQKKIRKIVVKLVKK